MSDDYVDEESVRDSRHDNKQVEVQETAGDEGDTKWSVALDWFEDAPRWQLLTKNRGQSPFVGVILCTYPPPSLRQLVSVHKVGVHVSMPRILTDHI